jgi:hypothetical protein
VLVAVFLGFPMVLTVMGVDVNASVIVNALAAIGAFSAAAAAVRTPGAAQPACGSEPIDRSAKNADHHGRAAHLESAAREIHRGVTRWISPSFVPARKHVNLRVDPDNEDA